MRVSATSLLLVVLSSTWAGPGPGPPQSRWDQQPQADWREPPQVDWGRSPRPHWGRSPQPRWGRRPTTGWGRRPFSWMPGLRRSPSRGPRQDERNADVQVLLFGHTTSIPAQEIDLTLHKFRHKNVWYLLKEAITQSIVKNQDIGVLLPVLVWVAVAAVAAVFLKARPQANQAAILSSGRGLPDDFWDVHTTEWMQQLQQDFENSWDTATA